MWFLKICQLLNYLEENKVMDKIKTKQPADRENCWKNKSKRRKVSIKVASDHGENKTFECDTCGAKFGRNSTSLLWLSKSTVKKIFPTVNYLFSRIHERENSVSRNRFANSRALAREFVTCFETHCFPLSECWKTGNEPIGKIFETVNLDNYSNRLLFLMYQVFTTENMV